MKRLFGLGVLLALPAGVLAQATNFPNTTIRGAAHRICAVYAALQAAAPAACVKLVRSEPFPPDESPLPKYPDAAKEIAAWRKIVKTARWRNFVEVRQVFKDADAVKGYVIFNIRQNRYRLVTIIHYSREKDVQLTEGHVYIRSFLTHKGYDDPANWEKGVPR